MQVAFLDAAVPKAYQALHGGGQQRQPNGAQPASSSGGGLWGAMRARHQEWAGDT